MYGRINVTFNIKKIARLAKVELPEQNGVEVILYSVQERLYLLCTATENAREKRDNILVCCPILPLFNLYNTRALCIFGGCAALV